MVLKLSNRLFCGPLAHYHAYSEGHHDDDNNVMMTMMMMVMISTIRSVAVPASADHHTDTQHRD